MRFQDKINIIDKKVCNLWKKLLKKIDGYSIIYLGILLGLSCYADMLSTFIGINMGMMEMNELIDYMFNVNPYLIFLYPIVILFFVFVFYKLLHRWELALKIGYIFLTFQFMMASVTNVLGMVMMQ